MLDLAPNSFVLSSRHVRYCPVLFVLCSGLSETTDHRLYFRLVGGLRCEIQVIVGPELVPTSPGPDHVKRVEKPVGPVWFR